MKSWLWVVLLVVGCSSGAGVDGDVVAEAPAKVRTICADEVAREIDPALDDLIGDALLYWADEAEGLLRHAPGEECDVPVYFSGESNWRNSEASARASVKGELEPGCRPVKIQLRESRWDHIRQEGWQHFIVFHEVGHLLCKDHADHGIMRYDGHLGVN